MNDRTRWNGPRDERDREDYGNRQQGGWGGGQAAHGEGRPGQPEQRSFGGGQQGYGRGGPYGGPRDEGYAGDYRGSEWRGTRDWGDAQSRDHRDDDRTHERSFGEHRDRGQDQEHSRGGSWAQRAWGGSSVREGDRGLGGAGGYGESFQRDDRQRDDRHRPGSQSFAAGYGMTDGPNYDERGPQGRERSWGGAAGASTPGYGRGYGPDYGRDDNRGFFERAGEQIASWFGSDDPQDGRSRDQRESHRGRGPGDYTRSDERIREDANDRLTDDHRVDARRITVTVEQGEITLAGTVPDRDAKRRAEDVVEHISGVKHVQNNLRIEARNQQAGQPQGASTSPWAAAQGGSTGEAGLSGGGRPDASAASPASGADARSTSASTGTSGSAATGSSGAGSTGSSATGAPTTGGSKAS